MAVAAALASLVLLDGEPEWLTSEPSLAGRPPQRVLFLLPDTGFDPTEVAVPFVVLQRAGHRITVATESGRAAPSADQLVVNGYIFGLLGAKGENLEAYRAFQGSREAQSPIRWADAREEKFDALVLPGGHHKDMIPYLTSKVNQEIARRFLASGKPVGAICHGVLVLSRAGALSGRAVTTVARWMEWIAYLVTFPVYGTYHLDTTMPHFTQDEVEAAAGTYVTGPFNPVHTLWLSTSKDHSRSHTVRSGNLLTARFFGDAWAFAERFERMLGLSNKK